MAPIPDDRLDLFEKPAIATFASMLPNGHPQVTPVWVDYDGTYVLVVIRTGTRENTATSNTIPASQSRSSTRTTSIDTWRSEGKSSGCPRTGHWISATDRPDATGASTSTPTNAIHRACFSTSGRLKWSRHRLDHRSVTTPRLPEREERPYWPLPHSVLAAVTLETHPRTRNPPTPRSTVVRRPLRRSSYR